MALEDLRHGVVLLLTVELYHLGGRHRGVAMKVFWIAPGGGVEPGESIVQTLAREHQEELGLRAFQIAPLVWRRQHTFNWDGKRICQSEHYHVV